MLGAIAIALSEEGSVSQPVSSSFTHVVASSLVLFSQGITVDIDCLLNNLLESPSASSTVLIHLALLPFGTGAPNDKKKNVFHRLFCLLTYNR
jgi:hypothetical protein